MHRTEMVFVHVGAPGTSHSWSLSLRGWVRVERVTRAWAGVGVGHRALAAPPPRPP